MNKKLYMPVHELKHIWWRRKFWSSYIQPQRFRWLVIGPKTQQCYDRRHINEVSGGRRHWRHAVCFSQRQRCFTKKTSKVCNFYYTWYTVFVFVFAVYLQTAYPATFSSRVGLFSLTVRLSRDIHDAGNLPGRKVVGVDHLTCFKTLQPSLNQF